MHRRFSLPNLFLSVVSALAFAAHPVRAEGITMASFEKDCLPLLKDQPALILYLKTLDIEPLGKAGMGFDEKGRAAPGLPMLFAARLGGTSGPRLLMLLFHTKKPENIAARIIGGEGIQGGIGVTMWQRPPGQEETAPGQKAN